MKKITVFDTTLRDGAQGEGISYTLRDKLAISHKLDRMGIDYIEGGNPFSNPRDMELFQALLHNPLSHAKPVAFGSTRRKDGSAEADANLNALLESGAETISVFGKADKAQVVDILQTTPEENLAMISDSIRFLKQHGRTVFFDAEHFFDGYLANPAYALAALHAAESAGADALILCDTKGGLLPQAVAEIISAVQAAVSTELGIHCHNDIGCAAANTILAVQSGCSQIQGTFLGFGERCGNTNLSTVIPTLQIKLGYSCVDDSQLCRLTKTARFIADLTNIPLDKGLPYVGGAAFSHKGGMHVDGVTKNTASFEHIPPEKVGNKRNILLSEVSGRAAMLPLIREVDPTITKDSPEAQKLTDLLKERESQGYLFESAQASLELLVTKALGKFRPFFRIQRFKVIGEQDEQGHAGLSSAMINIRVGEDIEITAAEGDGPVHALDRALKRAVVRFYPCVGSLRLIDYKVRVIEPSDATAALVRVLITTTNGQEIWSTIGVSRDIIKASLDALMESLEYSLLREENTPPVNKAD